MGISSVIKVVVAAWAILTCVSGTTLAQISQEPITLHVHPGTGDDDNLGTFGEPFLTLNKALEVAYELRHPPLGDPPDPQEPVPIVEIKVYYDPDWPIAPTSHGGRESFGWQTPAEQAGGPTHKPFPLRMVSGVNVIGVARNGNRPVIEIDELAWGGFPPASWEPGLPHTYVWMKSNMELRGFFLNGDKYDLNRANHALSAVYARNRTNVTISDCEIFNFHDGIWFYAEPGKLTSGVVRDSYLHDFFPVGSNTQDKGHAGIWVTGEGTLDVDLLDVEISDAHDALEIAGVLGGNTIASVDIVDCNFHHVENGLEVAGPGQSSFTVTGTEFFRNGNILPGGKEPDAGGGPGSTGALAVRADMVEILGHVRDCTFKDNAWSVLWATDRLAGSTTILDLGTDCDPGGNAFLPYDFNFTDPNLENVYRVHVYQATEVGQGDAFVARIDAAGNTWIPGQQGADPVDGSLAAGMVFGPNVNTPHNGFPPGPFETEFSAPGVPRNRNYSIHFTNGLIDFGDGVCP